MPQRVSDFHYLFMISVCHSNNSLRNLISVEMQRLEMTDKNVKILRRLKFLIATVHFLPALIPVLSLIKADRSVLFTFIRRQKEQGKLEERRVEESKTSMYK